MKKTNVYKCKQKFVNFISNPLRIKHIMFEENQEFHLCQCYECKEWITEDRVDVDFYIRVLEDKREVEICLNCYEKT